MPVGRVFVELGCELCEDWEWCCGVLWEAHCCEEVVAKEAS
jgi:hypothetical protein